ncbi:hypothetical protein HUJ04_004253 [Dendroctonus ponderosae]|nr:hypothetical protein HUJ04_004253 [Dendroctonus ponderosae]
MICCFSILFVAPYHRPCKKQRAPRAGHFRSGFNIEVLLPYWLCHQWVPQSEVFGY